MLHVKWGVMSGGAGFVLAFITSLLMGHVGLLTALLRALGFAAAFFGLGLGVRGLISSFIPELLFTDSPKNTATRGKAVAANTENILGMDMTGSQVDITVDDTPGNRPPGTATLDDDRPPGAALPNTNNSVVEVGNITDLIAGTANPIKDIDQNAANGYNDDIGLFAHVLGNTSMGEQGDSVLDFGAFSADSTFVSGKNAESSDEGFEDTGSMMDSFALFPGAGESEYQDGASMPERQVSKNKPEKLEGDFNAKEIAAGIRTVLEKDKRG